MRRKIQCDIQQAVVFISNTHYIGRRQCVDEAHADYRRLRAGIANGDNNQPHVRGRVNAVIRPGLPSALTLEIRDFVFTSGHVRWIAEFAFSPGTCVSRARVCHRLRVSTRKHTC